MKMRSVPTINIPVNGSVRFEPGGNHLMLIGLKHPLDAGYRSPLTLRFRRLAEMSALVRVMDSFPESHVSTHQYKHKPVTEQ